MKTIFKIQALSFFIILLITSCSKDDLPILEIKDYTTAINENPSFDQLIGTIHLKRIVIGNFIIRLLFCHNLLKMHFL